jgi:pimeloyl-ACP methyl ester carboxylesterase
MILSIHKKNKMNKTLLRAHFNEQCNNEPLIGVMSAYILCSSRIAGFDDLLDPRPSCRIPSIVCLPGVIANRRKRPEMKKVRLSGRFRIHVKVIALVICWFTGSSEAWKACSSEEGGGVCPDFNHCCPISKAAGSSCISESKDPHSGTGTCCGGGDGATGCGPDYSCSLDGLTCELTNSTTEGQPDTLPSYQLCSLPNPSSLQLRALSIEPGAPQLAYYSTTDIKQDPSIRIALIIIHGSGRNADDYLCCGISSVPPALRGSTVVITPIFLANEDGTMPTPVPLLRWNDTDPIPHTWRYGANAINANISSYQAIDTFIEKIIDRLPNLERVIIAGHSAGGQFTHRWALTSGSKLWNQAVSIRVVAANPRSFCYLDGRRFLNGTFCIPNASTLSNCPGYDQWEWGLEQGGRLTTPYFDTALEQIGGKELMVQRYGRRDVVYLAGALDTLTVRSECESDEFQGPTRRARSNLFFASLKYIYGTEQVRHRRLVAYGVPHDHCLIFQSLAGRQALFGDSVHLVSERGRQALDGGASIA